MENLVAIGKMDHTWKSESLLEKWVTTNKWSHLVKKCHTWKTGSYLENWVKLKKISHSWKNRAHFEKWVTLGKMSDYWKNRAHLKKWVTLGKMRHTGNIKSFLGEEGRTWKSGSVLEKLLTMENRIRLGKVGHS